MINNLIKICLAVGLLIFAAVGLSIVLCPAAVPPCDSAYTAVYKVEASGKTFESINQCDGQGRVRSRSSAWTDQYILHDYPKDKTYIVNEKTKKYSVNPLVKEPLFDETSMQSPITAVFYLGKDKIENRDCRHYMFINFTGLYEVWYSTQLNCALKYQVQPTFPGPALIKYTLIKYDRAQPNLELFDLTKFGQDKEGH